MTEQRRRTWVGLAGALLGVLLALAAPLAAEAQDGAEAAAAAQDGAEAAAPAQDAAEAAAAATPTWEVLVGGTIPADYDPMPCVDGLDPAVTPHRDGFGASAVIVVGDRAEVRELFWHAGHALPGKLKRCLGKALKAQPWPKAADRDGLGTGQYAVFLTFVFRRIGAEQPTVIAKEAVDEARAPHVRDLARCMYKTAPSLFGLTVNGAGNVVGVSVLQTAGGHPLPMEGASCAAAIFKRFDFPATLEETARLALVRTAGRGELVEPPFQRFPR